MTLGKEITRICMLGALAVFAVGCRSVGLESMHSSSAPNQKSPYKGDPYTWGGIQEGTGGLVVADKKTMETPTYTEPKYLVLAGPLGFVSMSGWILMPARPNDVIGDYQPLPGDAHGNEHQEEGH